MDPKAEVTQAAPEIKPDATAPAPDTSTPAPTPEGEGEPTPPKTALEAAQRVMDKEAKAAPAPQPKDPAEPAPDQPKPEAKAAADEDESKLPFREHPRWKQMSSEHRMLKVAKEKNEEAIKALEPKARTLDELTGYLRDNNLAREDFQSGLTIMTAIRNDPEAAYKLLKPVMDKLELSVGITLPDDLKARVDAGTVDADTARELARTRTSEATARARAEQQEQRRAQDAEARERDDGERAMQSVADSLNSWEVEWGKRDPDAPKLRQTVADLLLLRGGEKPPRNAEEARELAESCLTEARKRFSAFIPQPRAKEGVLPVGAATVATTQVPKSSLDAARAALTG